MYSLFCLYLLLNIDVGTGPIINVLSKNQTFLKFIILTADKNVCKVYGPVCVMDVFLFQCCPGYVDTDMTSHKGWKTLDEGKLSALSVYI